jgi:preprotein translocase SecE subunit
VARNRKRAKERRARRPQPAQVSRPGVGTSRPDLDEAPSPLEHAAPDVELADAQVALGRPELPDSSAPPEPESAELDEESADVDEEPADEFEDEAEAASEAGSGGRGLATIDTETGAAVAPRRLPGNRLITFLQGSWHELQRVQWPDRRQVVQATGVVIGFVIVAGIYLGVADALAGKLMNLILK